VGLAGSATSGAGQHLDAGREARQLPRHGIGMDHALAGGTLQLRLRRPQGVRGSRLVTACNRAFHLLDKGAHARLARLVAGSTGRGLTDALSRRCGIGHAFFDQQVMGAGWCQVANLSSSRRKTGVLSSAPVRVKDVAQDENRRQAGKTKDPQGRGTSTTGRPAFSSGSTQILIIR
jgi:hypothetical protein